MIRVTDQAPRGAREWQVTVPIPEGAAIGDHAAHDAAAAAAAPHGWYCVGTIPISPREHDRLDDPRAWRLRITYWPEAWRERTTLLAPPAVYAAAQISGLPTTLDGTLIADHDGIQYRTPSGRPLARQCYWEGRERLPDGVRRALDTISEIDRQRKTGHMRGRPDTIRARQLAADLEIADRGRRGVACATVRAWIEAEHPEVLS